MISCTVIVPSIGSKYLRYCINSIYKQRFNRNKYQLNTIVVSDGLKYFDTISNICRHYQYNMKNIIVTSTPENTGGNGFNGHRIYGAYSYLVNTDYICFLDEDNEYSFSHFENVFENIEKNNFPEWLYTFRSIIDKNDDYQCYDHCESLGHLSHTCLNYDDYLVDVNCYILRRDTAVSCSPIWYRKARPEGMLEVDREMFKILSKNRQKFSIVPYHSVLYRTGNREDSVKTEFFLNGNQAISNLYGSDFIENKILKIREDSS